jgi:hypothetical protein
MRATNSELLTFTAATLTKILTWSPAIGGSLSARDRRSLSFKLRDNTAK